MAEQQTLDSTPEQGQGTPMRPRPRQKGEDWFVASTTSRHRLSVRHKAGRAAARDADHDDSPIIFVHGATLAGSAVYDANLPGGSWMDYASARGYDTFAMDVRGYGKSTHPLALDEVSWRNRPQVHTSDAMDDLSDVVDAVLQRTGAAQVNLVGWSWGTSICGGYAARFPRHVRSVSLFAPLWVLRDFLGFPISRSPMWPVAWAFPWISRSPYWLGAWRDVDAKHIRQRQARGVPPKLVAELLPQAQFEQWWSELEAEGLATQRPHAAAASVVRAPNGVLADLLGLWANGQSTWDASRVESPTLLVAGAQDCDTPPSMASELYKALTHAANKQLLILDRATHWMTLQANRFDLYQSVQDFIDRPYGPGN